MSEAHSLSKIRIIGGEWRSRRIEVPEAIGLRPTPDRVRETLFNWLGQDLSGMRCLDLFAGSGALGFEAASRGAETVVMVEAASQALAHLRHTASILRSNQIRIQGGDALRFLGATQERFDVVFLDPPYNQGWIERLAPKLETVLAEGARVYVESEREITSLGNLTSVKSARAGQVHYQLLCASTNKDDHE